MKRNKKIIAVVASVAIVSQLLPMGTVIANAQTNSTINQVQTCRNKIYIYNEEGTHGLEVSIDNAHKQLKSNILSTSCDATFSSDKSKTTKDCLAIVIYDENRKIIDEFHFKGSDHLSDVVNKLNCEEFKYGYGMRIVHRESGSRVKISGEIINEASNWDKGVDKKILRSTVLINREFALEKQQDKYWDTNDYSIYLK